MNNDRRNKFKLLSLTLIGAGLISASLSMPASASGASGDDDDENDGYRAGMVFVSTNSTTANEVLVYAVGKDGKLTLQTRVATNGQGTGTGLGNQGAVTLSRNGRSLFVVNAQSNSVSTFSVRRDSLTLRSTVASGGTRPVSVTERDGLVYVLNAGGVGNVAGFRYVGGDLRPLADSVRQLSASSGTNAAQVGFDNDGDFLLVTEKGTNNLTTYRVRRDGGIDAPIVTASAGQTPFGFTFDRRDNLLVSEAFGGATNASAVSSYGFSYAAPTKPVVVSASVGTTQSAACWIVATPDGRYAYTTNTASATISKYSVQRNGKLSLAQGIAATTDAGPIDAAISPSGRHLFVLNGTAHSISTFAISRDGNLTNTGTTTNLPTGANGMAAN